jgi:hypothetical protein
LIEILLPKLNKSSKVTFSIESISGVSKFGASNLKELSSSGTELDSSEDEPLDVLELIILDNSLVTISETIEDITSLDITSLV